MEKNPVDTTIGRMMKLVTQRDIVELTGIIHRFRGQVWKRAVHSGHRLRSALSDMWIDVDSTVDGVYGNQEGAEVGYNPKKKGQKAYQYLMAFVGETKAVRKLVKIERGLFPLPLYEYFCYVTTERLSPIEAHGSYGERATCETWIEECKSQMNAGHLRTGEFLTNAALFQCAENTAKGDGIPPCRFCRSEWLNQDYFPVLFVHNETE